MSTHPKGTSGWRQRDNAKSPARMRRLAAGVRIRLEEGATVPGAETGKPTVARAFAGKRAEEFVYEGTLREDDRQIAGIVPTRAARQWADAHRQHDCPRYVACLDAAVKAQGDGLLGGGQTWVCDGCGVRA